MLSGTGRFTADLQALAQAMRDSLLEHPGLEELLDYLVGETSPADADLLREHLYICPDCCRILLEAHAFAESSVQVESGASEVEISARWRELRPRLPLVSKDSHARRYPTRPWGTAYHLAATLLIALLGLSSYVLTLRREIRDLKGPPRSIPIAELIAREDVTRGDERSQSVRIPRTAEGIVLLLGLLDGGDYDRYRASFQCDGNPRSAQIVEGLRRNPEGDFTVLIPRDFLSVGHCQIRLFGVEEGRASQVASYDAEIAYE